MGIRTSNKTEYFPERVQSGIKGYREIADYGRRSNSSNGIRGVNSAEKSIKNTNVYMNNNGSNNKSNVIDGSSLEQNLTTETKGNNSNNNL